MTESERALWLMDRSRRAKKDSKALALLLEAVELDPLNKKAQMSLASLYLRTREYEAAERKFEEVLELDDEILDAMSGLAQARMGLGKYLEAADILRQALRHRPQSPLFRSALGDAYLRAGYPAEAEKEYHWLKMMYPAEQDGYVALSSIWREIGYLDRAQKVLEEGLTIVFHKEGLYREMGRLKEAIGAWDEAIQYYRKAIASSAMDHSSRRRIAWCYWEKSEPAGAFRAMQRLKTFDSSSVSHYEYQVARCLWKGSNVDSIVGKALRNLEEAGSLLVLAQGLQKTQSHEPSVQLLKRAKSIDSKNEMVHFHLGRSLRLLNRMEEAEEALYVAMTEGHNPLQVRMELAQLHMATGNEDMARMEVVMALQLYPHYQASHEIQRISRESAMFRKIAAKACVERIQMEGQKDTAENAARILLALSQKEMTP